MMMRRKRKKEWRMRSRKKGERMDEKDERKGAV